MGLIFALFVAGYMVGVWTACVVLGQGQSEYEDGARRVFVPVSIRSRRPE